MLTGNALIRILADDLFASDLNELGVGVEDEADDDDDLLFILMDFVDLLYFFFKLIFILYEHQYVVSFFPRRLKELRTHNIYKNKNKIEYTKIKFLHNNANNQNNNE